MKQLEVAELNRIYSDAEECDKEIYAEQRSNVLLIAGDHYTKKNNRTFQRVRQNESLSDTQKLRLTKNHLHRVYRIYEGRIGAYSPGVTIVPHNELEIQDQKNAELNKAVWEDAKSYYRLHEKIRSWRQEFVGVGECAVKIFFDPNKGDFLRYEQAMDNTTGEPAVDENGQPVDNVDKPVFSGAFVFERVFGFNLMRCPGAETMMESPYLIIRKMVKTAHLKQLYAGDEKKLKYITESSKSTYTIFDSNKAEYEKSKDETLVKEIYYRPCYEYPNGYYAIYTEEGILEQGEIPYGLFPIIWAGFDEYPTAPRGRSIIKQLRPYQAELNRAASSCATHQVTLGDDKIVYPGGAKLAPGTLLPGVRGISYNGVVPPTILPGRDGGQYLPYIESQKNELYQVAEMSEENEEQAAQVDAYAMLFSSMKQRRKYATYSEKFEQFLIDVCELYLNLAKRYLSDEALINAIGKDEQVNIAEFRSTTKLCYQIKVEAKDETAETQLGKQLTMNHILQYVGPNLGKDDIGKVIRNMPFANAEESFRDFTLDYDCTNNDFLAMERGEQPVVSQMDNHEYALKRVASRMKEPAFRFLSPDVKNLYMNYKQQHEQFAAQQAQALIDAKNEFIPVGGALIAADLYVPNPEDPSKAAKRIRIPYQALDWLVEKLEKQGMALDKIEKMNRGVVSDMVAMKNQQPQNNPAPSSPTSPYMMMGGAGQASPIGVS